MRPCSRCPQPPAPALRATRFRPACSDRYVHQLMTASMVSCCVFETRQRQAAGLLQRESASQRNADDLANHGTELLASIAGTCRAMGLSHRDSRRGGHARCAPPAAARGAPSTRARRARRCSNRDARQPDAGACRCSWSVDSPGLNHGLVANSSMRPFRSWAALPSPGSSLGPKRPSGSACSPGSRCAAGWRARAAARRTRQVKPTFAISASAAGDEHLQQHVEHVRVRLLDLVEAARWGLAAHRSVR